MTEAQSPRSTAASAGEGQNHSVDIRTVSTGTHHAVHQRITATTQGCPVTAAKRHTAPRVLGNASVQLILAAFRRAGTTLLQAALASLPRHSKQTVHTGTSPRPLNTPRVARAGTQFAARPVRTGGLQDGTVTPVVLNRAEFRRTSLFPSRQSCSQHCANACRKLLSKSARNNVATPSLCAGQHARGPSAADQVRGFG